eukprot:TRINITY_DN1043_c0_g1_i1.p1 TRINITY_DN1043_c0_g1~~TRINITY_DN1043_c0_g1_i1.p1  ORF type:complete len:394 (-),score=72.99 TRINITY_DN1043_c0_g1_i1:315-1496(-)
MRAHVRLCAIVILRRMVCSSCTDKDITVFRRQKIPGGDAVGVGVVGVGRVGAQACGPGPDPLGQLGRVVGLRFSGPRAPGVEHRPRVKFDQRRPPHQPAGGTPAAQLARAWQLIVGRLDRRGSPEAGQPRTDNIGTRCSACDALEPEPRRTCRTGSSAGDDADQQQSVPTPDDPRPDAHLSVGPASPRAPLHEDIPAVRSATPRTGGDATDAESPTRASANPHGSEASDARDDPYGPDAFGVSADVRGSTSAHGSAPVSPDDVAVVLGHGQSLYACQQSEHSDASVRDADDSPGASASDTADAHLVRSGDGADVRDARDVRDGTTAALDNGANNDRSRSNSSSSSSSDSSSSSSLSSSSSSSISSSASSPSSGSVSPASGRVSSDSTPATDSS